jgi:hypothetical protein
MKVNILREITKYLNNNHVLTLAVVQANKPWVCTLFYGIDKNLNLFVLTDPNSVHGKIMEKNTVVAFNIYDSRQKVINPPKGIQGKATISAVKGAIATSQALLLWHKSNPGVQKDITVQDILTKVSDSKAYKITPSYIKYFNKTLFKPEKYGELHF